MSEGDSSSWPDDDDPFSTIEEKDEKTEEIIDSEEIDDSTPSAEQEDAPQIDIIENIPWSLPIRSAPIMAQTRDIVQEFPLNESPDGLNSTSIVVNDDLIRIVEATYGEDGQRRLNVKTVMKQKLTGFSHTHNELMHKHQWLWIAAFIVGLGFSFVALLSLFGQLLLVVGLIGWIYMHLEVHTLEFSSHGSKHRLILTGYGSNRAMFRASMALIGPTMAKYIETGDFDTKSIEDLHESLAKPPEVIPPVMAVQPNQMEPLTTNAAPVNQNIPALPPITPPAKSVEVPQNMTNDLPPPAPPQSNHLPPPAPPETNQMPPPAPPQSNQLPPPAPPETNQMLPPAPSQQNGPPTSNTMPPPSSLAPMNNALPPATLPPPLPPSGALSLPVGQLPPPIGLGLAPIDAGEVPLDAPLPDAPQIAVKASPIEESLSPDEQNELLNELK